MGHKELEEVFQTEIHFSFWPPVEPRFWSRKPRTKCSEVRLGHKTPQLKIPNEQAHVWAICAETSTLRQRKSRAPTSRDQVTSEGVWCQGGPGSGGAL